MVYNIKGNINKASEVHTHIYICVITKQRVHSREAREWKYYATVAKYKTVRPNSLVIVNKQNVHCVHIPSINSSSSSSSAKEQLYK